MKYKTRTGIVLTTICGQHVLVSAKEAGENCPYVTKINETAAFCWRLLENGSTCGQLADQLMEEYDAEDVSLVRVDVKKMLDHFLEEGYLVEMEGKDEETE